MSRGDKKQYEDWVFQEQEKLARRRETVCNSSKYCQPDLTSNAIVVLQCKALSKWEDAVKRLAMAKIEAKREARREEYVFLVAILKIIMIDRP